MENTVIIEVSGGIAYCTLAPEGLSVVVWDWDNFKAEAAPADYVPDQGPHPPNPSPIVVAYLHAQSGD